MAAGALSRSCLSYSAASLAGSARDLLKPLILHRHPSSRFCLAVSVFILRSRGPEGRGWPWPAAGLPRAAAEFAQDAPGFELGVGALAGGSWLGVGPVGLLLRGGLVAAPVGVSTGSPAPW